MEANRRAAMGPMVRNFAVSVAVIALVEKVFMALLLPPLVPTLEVAAAAMGRLPASVALTNVAVGAGFWGVGTLFMIPQFLGSTTWKIQEKRRLDLGMLRQHMPLIVFNFFVATLLTPVILYAFLPESAYDLRVLPGLWELLWNCTVWLVVQEIMFFYTHRWMHVDKRLYASIHKVHHAYTSPVSYTAIYCHPIENLVSNIPPLIVGPIICGSHVLAIAVFLFLAVVHVTSVHSGYWVCDDNGMHDEHHRRFDTNYGVNGIMDLLYGTYSLPPSASA
mmetsp:Transcript_113671/g.157289  ORF Transcript_113671/g.157289 Transcript_113671/m.157289 type:complete len:277 (-) Transcript_113671:62-892(-)